MNAYIEIFWRFLLLGCISFGGPVAHLGYFRKQFVDTLQWINDETYARIIALSQFLPGPGSSQTGFTIGYHRAGIGGGIAAFLGFTLPSFLLMFSFALLQSKLQHNASLNAIIDGLKLLAAVVVADACYKMFLKFCKTWQTQLICFISAAILINISGIAIQIIILIAAALIGYFCRQSLAPSQSQNPSPALPTHTRLNNIERTALPVFLILLLSSPLWMELSFMAQLFAQFYQAGSLVFGGGHVVLPLLQELFSQRVASEEFLAGYAAAQAVPGPMFSFATYLGTLVGEFAEFGGQTSKLHLFYSALVATLAIFLPGFLLVIGLYKRWEQLAQHSKISACVISLNAAVVGLLFSALYQPILLSSVLSWRDAILFMLSWALLTYAKIHIVWLVISFACIGLFIY